MCIRDSNRFEGPNANLSDLHLAAICVTTYSAFLRYNEVASLCCCDFSFCETFVKIFCIQEQNRCSVIVMAPMFCWQNLTLFLALFTCLTDTLVPLI